MLVVLIIANIINGVIKLKRNMNILMALMKKLSAKGLNAYSKSSHARR